MDAGKIYNTWPLMGNNYFPDDNSFNHILRIDTLSDPSLVQFIHRNLAYLIMLVFLLISILVIKGKMTRFYNIIKIIGVILFFQIFLGILTILTGAQMLLASMHLSLIHI